MDENLQSAVQTEESEEPEKKSHGDPLRDIIEIAETTIITIFAIVLIFTYILHPVNVVGGSMIPTLNDGDRVFMSMISPDISCGDIVVINNDAAYLLDQNGKVVSSTSSQLNECIIKRVIACGGQTIDIDFLSGSVTVDGKILDEPYINALTTHDDRAFSYPLTVPEGYYFVMGDNRNESSDSRNIYVGLIKREQIYGKAIIRYSPFSEFKFL
ncbi:MAG: signal peptidase I [Ruminococcus sp.]